MLFFVMKFQYIKILNRGSQYGYVPQSVYLLDDSILKNIVFDFNKLNDKKLSLALDQSGLKDWIESLIDGIETVARRGSKVSESKQRIGIAATYKIQNSNLMNH